MSMMPSGEFVTVGMAFAACMAVLFTMVRYWVARIERKLDDVLHQRILCTEKFAKKDSLLRAYERLDDLEPRVAKLEAKSGQGNDA